ncbi:MAG: SCE4755 family polysaccharide monooxygenase-like protein [Pseudomonadota bacterium]
MQFKTLFTFATIGSVALLATPQPVDAHAKWKFGGTLTARADVDNIKTGACGNLDRSPNPMTFQVGQTITVQWTETINHTGMYYIFFSPDGEQGLPSSVADLADETNLLHKEVDPNNQVPAEYTANITLPTEPCNNCVLQMVQFMQNNNSNYYSCADIVLAAAPAPEPPPPVDPAPPADTPISVTQQIYDDFEAIDTDNNGQLDFQEIQVVVELAEENFAGLDTDSDGFLTKEELIAAGAQEPVDASPEDPADDPPANSGGESNGDSDNENSDSTDNSEDENTATDEESANDNAAVEENLSDNPLSTEEESGHLGFLLLMLMTLIGLRRKQ